LNNPLLTIVTSLLSGLVGVLIGTWFSRHAEVRREKVEILKTLVTYITNPAAPERVSALNLIPVVFQKEKNICAALEDYKKTQSELSGNINTQLFSEKQDAHNDAYIKLLELIAKKMRYSSTLTWDKLKNPYYPKCFIGMDNNTYWY